LAQPLVIPTRRLPIQAKLTIGQPNDKYEQEADRVADQVMRMSNADVAQRVKTGTVQPMRIQRMCPECENKMAQRQPMEEEEELQAKEMPGKTPTVAPNLKFRINSLKGGGQPLDSTTRSFFEPRFGHDFSNVRVHTDSFSADTAKSINARAFTLGNHVVMGAGEYQPKSQAGQRLLGHELTHVVQQEKGSSPFTVPIIQRKSWYNFDIPGTDYHFDPSPQGVKNFANIAVSKIKAVLKLVVKQAQKIPGYKLLTLIIGYNPITRERVDRGELLTKIASMVPYGKKLTKHIKYLDDAVAKVMGWLGEQFTAADLTKLAIVKQFNHTVHSLSWYDMAFPPKGAYKIINNFVIPIASRVKNFVKIVAKKLFGAIFQWVLEKFGIHAKRIMDFVGKVSSVLVTIARDPIAFAKNLGAALEQGFYQFRDNFLTKYLPSALAKLVFGPMNIAVPKTLTFSSILNLSLQVMNLSYATGIRPKLVKRIGEKRVALIESSVKLIHEVKNKGIGVLWEKIKKFIGNLKELVIGKLKKWLITRVVIAGVKWIAGMFVPGGAFIKAIESVYNMFKVFLDRWEQIQTVISNVANSIGLIAAGRIKVAANKIELVLGDGLSIIIAFLANQLKLGSIGTKVRKIIKTIKERIHAALDRVVDYIIGLISKLFGKTKFAVGKALQWWRRRKAVRGGDKKTYTISISGGATAAKVMVKASPKRRFSLFLNKRKPQLTTQEQKKSMVVAERQVRVIENLRKKTAQTDAEFAGIKLNAFNSLADQLLIITGGTATPITEIRFGGLNADQGGTEMTARILSKDHPKGSVVRDKPFIWMDLYHMRAGRGAPYYIQGHLLNKNLGGPGKRFNLSPLTTKANRDHHDNVEKNIKKWVHDRRAPIVMYYNVKVNYPALSHSSRLTMLREKDENARTKVEKRELAELTKKRLAISFICTAYKLKYDNSQWVSDSRDSAHKINHVVKNE